MHSSIITEYWYKIKFIYSEKMARLEKCMGWGGRGYGGS